MKVENPHTNNFEQPHIDLDEQILLLKKRGLIISNEVTARHFLSTISYFRLVPFVRFFQDKAKNFNEHVSIELVLEHYFFDRELRVLIFDVIERVEVALRTQISYIYSLNEIDLFNDKGKFIRKWWYENETNFINHDVHKVDLGSIDNQISRHLDLERKEIQTIKSHNHVDKHDEIQKIYESFVSQYKRIYSAPIRLPSWMLFEVITMGIISKLFTNLRSNSRKRKISRYFQLQSPDVLESWIHSFTYVRNICAHHSPLWSRNLIIRPKYPIVTPQPWLLNQYLHKNNSLFFFLSCSLYILKVINPDTSFIERFKNISYKYPDVNIQLLGFQKDWENEPIWSVA